jgi:hypothetical protein
MKYLMKYLGKKENFVLKARPLTKPYPVSGPGAEVAFEKADGEFMVAENPKMFKLLKVILDEKPPEEAKPADVPDGTEVVGAAPEEESTDDIDLGDATKDLEAPDENPDIPNAMTHTELMSSTVAKLQEHLKARYQFEAPEDMKRNQLVAKAKELEATLKAKEQEK